MSLRLTALLLLIGMADARAQAVIYSTGPLQGTVSGLAADSVGDLYVTGYLPSNASDICGYGFFGVPILCNHAFVAKLDPSGTYVVYNTVLAGTSEDRGASITVDTGGNVYVLGTTFSANFPVTSNAAQSKYGGPSIGNPNSYTSGPGGDLFIARLDPSGKLVYATFLGGPDDETAGRIRVDASGNAYVSGASGPQFPVTPGAYLGSAASSAGIVAKINQTGTKVIWATYVEGGSNGGVAHIDIDGSNHVYAAIGSSVTKLGADGTSAIYVSSSGKPDDFVTDLAVDAQSAAWIVGQAGAGGGFLRELSPDGSGTMFSTSLALTAETTASIAVDAVGGVYMAGVASQIAPTQNAVMPTYCTGVLPGFVEALSPAGGVIYSSYFSTSSRATGFPSLAIGKPGQIYTSDGQFLTKTDLNAQPGPNLACSVNGASFLVGSAAPGQIISLFGANLGPSDGDGLQLEPNGSVTTTLAGTRVLFNGAPAPLLYVSSTQINTVVPFGVQPGTGVQVAIEIGGQAFSILPLAIAGVAPGIFTLNPAGQAAVLNQDGTVNSPQNPAGRGSTISIFATGFGPFNPPLIDAEIAPVPASMLTVPVQVYFGGMPGTIVFAGSAPGLIAGVVQINVQAPSSFAAGVNLNAVPVSVLINNYDVSTQPGVTVALR
jgi:uncharacterized protein (TIGR03437 family)